MSTTGPIESDAPRSTDADATPLWRPPSPATSLLSRFARSVGIDGEYGVLHRWSTADPSAFWDAVWRFGGVIGERGTAPAFVAGPDGAGRFTRSRWFDGAEVCFAENVLAARGRSADDVCVVELDETGHRREWTLGALRLAVGSVERALGEAGVTEGDVVAAWVPNGSAALILMLAANALGAVFSSTSPDFGVEGVLDRFAQIAPKVFVGTGGYVYGGKYFDRSQQFARIVAGLPTATTLAVVDHPSAQSDVRDVGGRPVASWASLVDAYPDTQPHFCRRRFDQPGFILYSSGTTGPPKCIVHSAAGILLMHLREHQLHCDIRSGDRAFWFTTCGWMMWNWLVSAPASGASIVLYDGSPFAPGPEQLWDVAAAEGITHFGVSAKYLDSVAGARYRPTDRGDLASLRFVGSTGSPLSPERFDWVYEAVSPNVHLASLSGGTDLCGIFVGGVPTRPVWRGEIQGPALGMAVDAVDEDGVAVVGVPGELVCATPFPSVPLGFLNDPDGSRLNAAYFDRFPGRWHHGDFVTHTNHDGFVIHGRSDTTLNPGGVRIGTAEIYRQVEAIDAVQESLVFGQPHGDDVRIVLLVVMAAGHALDDELTAEIRRRIREGCTPRHVPSIIAAVDDLPRTRSNKLVESAVADVAAGRAVRNTEAIANPESLWAIRDLPELGLPATE